MSAVYPHMRAKALLYRRQVTLNKGYLFIGSPFFVPMISDTVSVVVREDGSLDDPFMYAEFTGRRPKMRRKP
jgi:hypothetical protein